MLFVSCKYFRKGIIIGRRQFPAKTFRKSGGLGVVESAKNAKAKQTTGAQERQIDESKEWNVPKLCPNREKTKEALRHGPVPEGLLTIAQGFNLGNPMPDGHKSRRDGWGPILQIEADAGHGTHSSVASGLAQHQNPAPKVEIPPPEQIQVPRTLANRPGRISKVPPELKPEAFGVRGQPRRRSGDPAVAWLGIEPHLEAKAKAPSQLRSAGALHESSLEPGFRFLRHWRRPKRWPQLLVNVA